MDGGGSICSHCLQPLQEINSREILTADYENLYAFEKVKCHYNSSNCKGIIEGSSAMYIKNSMLLIKPLEVVMPEIIVGCPDIVCISYRKALEQRIKEQQQEIRY